MVEEKNNPYEEIIGHYKDNDIDLTQLSQKIQHFLQENKLSNIKTEIQTDPEYQETIIAKHHFLYELKSIFNFLSKPLIGSVKITISGNPQDFVVKADYSGVNSATHHSFSNVGTTIEHSSNKSRKYITNSIGFLILDMKGTN